MSQKTTRGTRVGIVHVESTCCTCWIYLHSRVNRMSQKWHGHVCYSCSVLKWHMRSQTRMLEQHRHWATHAHPVLNSGTFDWHAIACSFSTFFFGVLVQLGPWGVVGNGCLGITEHIESKLIIVFSQLGIYPTSVKVKKRHDCIGLWNKATGQTWVTNQDAVLIVIFIKMRAWPSYLSPTSYRKPSPYLVWQPRILWRSMYPWGFLLQILTTFVSSATIVSVLLHYCEHHFTPWNIAFNVFGLKE